jgi:flagellin FlaB
MKLLIRNDRAFTGLEAAIVLIAFVVVAAVFSYVVLGAGFFTTQKSQETVHSSIEQASSSVEAVGNVYGIATKANDPALNYTKFTVALTSGGTEVDMSKVVVTYKNTTERKTLSYSTSTDEGVIAAGDLWGIVTKLNSDSDAVLETGEQFVIVASTKPVLNEKYYIELKPAIGAVYQVARTVPASLLKIQPIY